jgi:hypothetical protein
MNKIDLLIENYKSSERVYKFIGFLSLILMMISVLIDIKLSLLFVISYILTEVLSHKCEVKSRYYIELKNGR